ncbi:MAG TPA: hypothetical protein VG993_04635 [Actinomycetota bacterium]|jgi:hypothetical protein|nr:hypothetical protein [Actinomycetota bacterium]
MAGDLPDATRIELSRSDVEHVLSRFHVRLTDPDGSVSEHEITVSRADWERYGDGFETPEALVEASLRFLLARESKDQILRAFGLGQIGTYFPSYGRDITPTS